MAGALARVRALLLPPVLAEPCHRMTVLEDRLILNVKAMMRVAVVAIISLTTLQQAFKPRRCQCYFEIDKAPRPAFILINSFCQTQPNY